VWAEVVYPDGSKKQTDIIALTSGTTDDTKSGQHVADGTASLIPDKESMVTPDDKSARR
jgi:hypothetical protein